MLSSLSTEVTSVPVPPIDIIETLGGAELGVTSRTKKAGQKFALILILPPLLVGDQQTIIDVLYIKSENMLSILICIIIDLLYCTFLTMSSESCTLTIRTVSVLQYKNTTSSLMHRHALLHENTMILRFFEKILTK